MIALLILLTIGGLMHAARSFASSSGGSTELAFGFLLLAAYFMGKLVARFGLPKLTGYLATGIIAGPFVLGLVTKDMTSSLKVVNGAAICILGLTAGSELNLKRVRPIAATLRAITLFAVLAGMGVIGATLFFMRGMLPMFDGLSLTQALAVAMMIGVALSAQSPAVVMALVSETRSDGPLTQVILASVVVADLVVILCYAIASALTVATIGGGIDIVATAAAVAWEVVGSIVFGIAIGMLLGVFLRTVKSGASMFAVMVCIVVAEIGGRIHLDPLICMLAAGIWLENFSRADAHQLLHEFESAQLPVFLVFFALAGAKLDIIGLAHSILPVAILAGVRALAFFLGGRFATKVTRAPAVVTQYAWMGLVPQAGLALALAMLVQKNFPQFGNAAAVLLFGVVGLNELIAPIILRSVLLRSGEAGKRAAPDFAPDH